MTLQRPPQPPSTWLLATVAVFLLVLNVGMLCLLTAPPVVLDAVMGVLVLAIGAGLSLLIKPWLWFEDRG